jgi:hypothetical protein
MSAAEKAVRFEYEYHESNDGLDHVVVAYADGESGSVAAFLFEDYARRMVDTWNLLCSMNPTDTFNMETGEIERRM